MPLFNLDDYANLHPELEQTPTGMTDVSYQNEMQSMYTDWLTSIVERWPDSEDEIVNAFSKESPIWTRVAPRHEYDDPYLALLTASSACLAEIIGCIHPDSIEDVIEHLTSVAKLSNKLHSDASNRAETDLVYSELFVLTRSRAEDSGLVFLMRLMDYAHDEEGYFDAEKALHLTVVAFAASVAVVVGNADLEARADFVMVLHALTERITAESALPYFEADNE